MTQPVYRNARPGPHCGSNRTPQHGVSRGKQTYRCQQCLYRLPPDGNRHYYPETVKVQTLRRYTDGMSIAAIGRALSIKAGIASSRVQKARPDALTRQTARQRRSRRAPQQPRPRAISFDWQAVDECRQSAAGPAALSLGVGGGSGGSGRPPLGRYRHTLAQALRWAVAGSALSCGYRRVCRRRSYTGATLMRCIGRGLAAARSVAGSSVLGSAIRAEMRARRVNAIDRRAGS